MKCFVSLLTGALLALMIMPTWRQAQLPDPCSMQPMFESWRGRVALSIHRSRSFKGRSTLTQVRIGSTRCGSASLPVRRKLMLRCSQAWMKEAMPRMAIWISYLFGMMKSHASTNAPSTATAWTAEKASSAPGRFTACATSTGAKADVLRCRKHNGQSYRHQHKAPCDVF